MALEIYFLNVGHGDCTVISFPSGRLAIIDVNNSPGLDPQTESDLAATYGVDASLYPIMKLFNELPSGLVIELSALSDRLIDPADFLKETFENRDIWRFILTHPDMDHMSGLYRLFNSSQENIGLTCFWDTENDKEMSKSDFDKGGSKGTWEDWQEYCKLRTSAQSPKVIHNYRGDTGRYWTEDKISILSPTQDLVKDANRKEDWNSLSYVLKIDYAGRRVLLGGDADANAWSDILEESEAEDIEADILKASHHGRDSGYHQPAVKAISPTFTIVSVGKKPETDASNKYRQYSDKVMSTRFHGSIRAKIWDDGEVWIFDWQNNRIDGSLAPPLR